MKFLLLSPNENETMMENGRYPDKRTVTLGYTYKRNLGPPPIGFQSTSLSTVLPSGGEHVVRCL